MIKWAVAGLVAVWLAGCQTRGHGEVFMSDAEIGGLKIVLAVALNLLPDEQKVLARLKLMEEMARRENLDSNTIAVLREFREKFS